MDFQFNILEVTRQNILNSIKELTIEQINCVTNQFNNSIGWQVTHLVVTQQLLHYKLSGNKLLIEDNLIENFRKGSSGAQQLSENEWSEVLSLFLELPKKLNLDYKESIFNEYSPYSTSYNVTLNNIENAIVFNNLHEAMHLGTINAMKKHLK